MFQGRRSSATFSLVWGNGARRFNPSVGPLGSSSRSSVYSGTDCVWWTLFEFPWLGSPLVSAVESLGESLRSLRRLSTLALCRSSTPPLNATKALHDAALRTSNPSQTTADPGPSFFPKIIKCSTIDFQSISPMVCITPLRLSYDSWLMRGSEFQQVANCTHDTLRHCVCANK